MTVVLTRRPTRRRLRLDAGVALGAAVFAVSFFRYWRGWPSAFDLGVFDQAEWLLARGHAHVSLLQRHILGDHMSPVLLLLAPLYWLKATPVWLLLVQAAAVGATVRPMQALAGADHPRRRRLAAVLTAANPALWSAAVFDFHASTLAVPAVAWLVVGARRGDRRLVTWAGAAVLFCRADLAPLVAAVALVSTPEVRRRLLGLASAGAVASVLPTAFGAGTLWASMYPNLGTGPLDAALHPYRAVAGVLRPGSLFVLAVWLAPALPRIGWRWRWQWLAAVTVAAAPVLMIGKTGWWTAYFQHGAPLAPLVVAAALAGGASTRRLVAATAVALLVASPLAPLAPVELSVWELGHDGPLAHPAPAALALVGPRDAVSTQYLPALAHRGEAYAWPLPFVDGEPAGGPASSAAAAQVDVVVVQARYRESLARIGFTRLLYDDGRVLVARRPA